MRWLSPYSRLVLRPVVLAGWLWPIGLLGFISLLTPADTMPLVHALRGGELDDAARMTFWRLVIVIPACTGFVVGVTFLDLFKGAFAWNLPRQHERLFSGLAITGLLSAIPASAFLASRDLVPEAGAALATGVLAFVAGTSLMRVTSGSQFALRLAILVGAWKAAAWLGDAASDQPAAITLLAGVALVASYRPVFSLETTRTWMEAVQLYRERTGSRPMALAGLGEATWNRSLVGGSIYAWLRAREYEVFGFSRAGAVGVLFLLSVLWLAMQFWSIGVKGLWFGLLTVPLFVAMGTFPMVRPGGTYPLSRSRRAAITYWAGVAMIGTGTVLAVAVALLLALLVRGPDGLASIWDWESAQLPAFVIPWTPVLLWFETRYARIHPLPGPSVFVGWMAAIVLMMIGGMTTALVVLESGMFDSVAARLTAWALVAVSLQATHWFLLRRYFTRGDLR